MKKLPGFYNVSVRYESNIPVPLGYVLVSDSQVDEEITYKGQIYVIIHRTGADPTGHLVVRRK
jgi:hypothetical protein